MKDEIRKYYCCDGFKDLKEQCGYYDVNLDEKKEKTLVLGLYVLTKYEPGKKGKEIWKIFRYCPFCQKRIGDFD